MEEKTQVDRKYSNINSIETYSNM